MCLVISRALPVLRRCPTANQRLRIVQLIKLPPGSIRIFPIKKTKINIMKKVVAVVCFIVGSCAGANAQIFMTRTGFIGFYSKTSLEDIKAENNQVYAVIDASKKNLAFSVLLKGFIFKKELMQDHFNDNYVESDKYPKATFN